MNPNFICATIAYQGKCAVCQEALPGKQSQCTSCGQVYRHQDGCRYIILNEQQLKLLQHYQCILDEERH